MTYVYSIPRCGKCLALKARLKAQGVEFVERDGKRLIESQHDDWDEIDVEAAAQFALQENEFPVEVEG